MTGDLRYFPGTAYLVVGPVAVVLTTDEKLGRRLWPLIAEGAAGRTVLDEALRDGLTQLPDLLLVEFEGSQTRIVARGAHAADVLTVGGEVQACTGRDLRTWAERTFTDAESVTVDNPVGDWLPIALGIVRSGGFAWSNVPAVRAVGFDTDGVVAPSAPGWTFEKPETPEPFVLLPPAMALPEMALPETVLPETVQPETEAADAPEQVDGLSAAAAERLPRPGLAETRTEPADEGFDHLFGSTVYRSVEDAAVREVVDNPEPALQLLPESITATGDFGQVAVLEHRQLGDHDGSTIMATELAALRSQIAEPVAAERSAHPAPAVAGVAIAKVPRRNGPPAAILQLSTGGRIELDRGAVIGRRPQVDRVAGGAIPRLVTVESPQQDISRSHLQITCDTDGYLATDLHSMNGTVVTGADGVTVTLTAGQQHQLHIGDVLDLGDGVTATLRAAT